MKKIYPLAGCFLLVFIFFLYESRWDDTPQMLWDGKHNSYMAYSVWMEPAGDVARRLQEEIDTLHSQFASPSIPPFVPLVGPVPAENERKMLHICQRLSKKLRPMPIMFTNVSLAAPGTSAGMGTGVEGLHALLLHGAEHHEMALSAWLARLMFEVKGDSFYVHMPLLLSATEIPENEAADVHRRLFNGSDSAPGLPHPRGFRVKGISLWRTPMLDVFASQGVLRDVVSQWQLVRSFKFPK